MGGVRVTLSMATMVLAGSLAADTYSAALDNINLDQVLSNDRLINNYANCFLDRGPCSPDALQIKRILPEVLKTGCSKCTQKQKEIGVKGIKFMSEKKPKVWQQLTNKFDPDGSYTKKFLENN